MKPDRAGAAATTLQLRCFLCGLERSIDDDGRRVRHAQVHLAACSTGPGPTAESHLHLSTLETLQVTLGDGTVWFEISRVAEEKQPKRKGGGPRGSAPRSGSAGRSPFRD